MACWQAELQDAERVLCSVAMLKRGLCSGRAAQKAKVAAGKVGQGSGGLSVGVRAHSAHRGTKKASLSHFAGDVESNVVSMFSPAGAGAAR
jgi:hypothetical protein